MLRQAPDALLAHLYRLPPEDYSYLIVLLVKRASSVDWGTLFMPLRMNVRSAYWHRTLPPIPRPVWMCRLFLSPFRL